MLNSRIIAEEIRPYLALAESIAAPLSDGTSGAGTVAVVLPSTLRPFPQISPASTEGRRRTPGRTRILTDTPEKNAIEDAANRRAQQLPASQMEKSRKRIKRSLDLEADENILVLMEEGDLDIDPLYQPDPILIQRPTRSGRVPKLNTRPNM